MARPIRCSRRFGAKKRRGRTKAKTSIARAIRNAISVKLATRTPTSLCSAAFCQSFVSGKDNPHRPVTITSMTVGDRANVRVTGCVGVIMSLRLSLADGGGRLGGGLRFAHLHLLLGVEHQRGADASQDD